MTPERWRQVTDLFHLALEREPGARDAFVREASGSDEELQREVLSLLRSHAKSGGYLDRPAWEVSTEMLHDASTLGSGQSIGKYRIVREVARGGMGVVYRGTDEVLGRTVALKALPAEYAHDKVRCERLVREARLSAQLNHRAIATVYELIDISNQLFIVSEFVQGTTLRRELADGPLPSGHLLGTLSEIAAALAAAHALNIIHRDLKPENIMRREDGQIKVLDFGLARPMSSSTLASSHLTELGMVAGTPGYMAPEMLNNSPADARSDIFVFGLVAWELATGRHPLGASTNTQMARLLDMTAGEEPEWPGPLPVPGLEAVLRRCLARLPQDRYQSAEALVGDLRSLQQSSARTGVGTSAPVEPRLWWWQVHQVTTAAVVASTPIWGWIARRWISFPRGAWVFFAILALATGSVILRLNLLFTSRAQPQLLPAHLARLSRWIPKVEGALCLLLLWAAALISSSHEAWAALLIGLAILIGASVAVIEPTTARGAGLLPDP